MCVFTMQFKLSKAAYEAELANVELPEGLPLPHDPWLNLTHFLLTF